MFFIHSLLLSQLLITTHLQNIETATESLFFINNLLDHFQNRNDLLFSVPLLSNYEWSTITSIVLDSIESAIEYLWAHRNKVNLDGYLGPRMLEGIIDTMLKLYQQKTPEDIAERMETILRKSQELTNFGLLNVKKQTPFYFSRVGFLLGPQLWNRYYPARLLSNFSTRYSPVKEDSWTEYESDNCLREFLDKTDENYCNISYKCWKSATSEIKLNTA
ncbi:unnamed protein product [Heterobilharzia americana]|nr:unnamed protein product [Heterobilharzia americana]